MRDVVVAETGIDARERLEIGVNALERSQDRVERFVAWSVHEARLAARDAQPRCRVEHLVEPAVQSGDAVLEDLLAIDHRVHARLGRCEVMELEKDPLDEAEILEHEKALRIVFAHPSDVVHLHRDGEVPKRPVFEERFGPLALPIGLGSQRRR